MLLADLHGDADRSDSRPAVGGAERDLAVVKLGVHDLAFGADFEQDG